MKTYEKPDFVKHPPLHVITGTIFYYYYYTYYTYTYYYYYY